MVRGKCLCCNQILESKSRHDFQKCDCANKAFVDGGGEDYIRMGAVDPTKLVLIDENDNPIVEKEEYTTTSNAKETEYTIAETPKDTLESPVWVRDTIAVPKMKWECSMFGVDTFKMQFVNPPNLFWRIMQRIFVGNRWRRL